MKSIKLFVIALFVAAISFAQTYPQYTYSATNPSPNASGGYCTLTSLPVYNYLSGTYWYCVANTTPPTNLGTWTSSTPPTGVLAGNGAGKTSLATAAQISTAFSFPTSATVLGTDSGALPVAATTTGSGTTVVLATSPTLVTPTIGVATATTVNKVTLTAPAAGSTLTIADGKTLTSSNTITLAGTDGSTYTGPAASVSFIGGSIDDCATTAACPNTLGTTMRTVIGRGTLVSASPSTYAVTAISPAFTSSTTYLCTAQDTTTIATNIGVLTAGYVSGSAVTFTGPNTNTDTFRFKCVGY